MSHAAQHSFMLHVKLMACGYVANFGSQWFGSPSTGHQRKEIWF